MAEKKELSNHEFNEEVFVAIARHEAEIEKLKAVLKPLELMKNTSLADCNAIAANRV